MQIDNVEQFSLTYVRAYAFGISDRSKKRTTPALRATPPYPRRGAFCPVAYRARSDGWRASQNGPFLACLSLTLTQ
jgi:hypothetical protein